MKPFVRVLAAAAVLCLWGVSVAELVRPGTVEDLSSLAQAALKSATTSDLYVLEDGDVPLAGPGMPGGKRDNGALRVEEGRLANEAGEPIQLRGMSSHGIAWYPQYTSVPAIATTGAYGANVFRVAMYVDEDRGNYTTTERDRRKNREAMYAALDNALNLDMYAIADWHVHKQGNPMDRVEDAVAFFGELSAHYADEPGLLYEICNEPNGADVTWDTIYEYATQVIPAIRENAPDAVIIVGTPEFSTNLYPAMLKPLPYENILYAYHYYTAYAQDAYRVTLDSALAAKLPVIVSEWGIGGDGSPADLAQEYASGFLAYLKENGISWVNWSLSNKNETFSAIRPGVRALSGWTEEDLTPGGKIVFAALAE